MDTLQTKSGLFHFLHYNVVHKLAARRGEVETELQAVFNENT